MSTTPGAVFITLVLAVATTLPVSDSCKDEYFRSVTFEKCYFSKVKDRENPVDFYAKALIINDCRISQLKPEELYGLANIEELDLSGNIIEHFDVSVLNMHVPSLKHLKLSFNKLRTAPVFDDYEVSPRLWTIDLGGNLITEIMDVKTFSTCDILNELRLHRNNIEHLHADLFKSLDNLMKLDLSNNKITHLDNSMFVSNKRLRQLFLQGNRIAQLPIDFISKHKSQALFDGDIRFRNKPWNCDCLFEVFGADYFRKMSRAIGYGYYADDTACNGTQPACVATGPCEPGAAVSPWLSASRDV